MQAVTLSREVLMQLDLQKNKHQGNLIAITERKNAHGNFILSTIMDYNLRNNTGICFVSLFNPVSHYQHVGIKLGCNLKSGIEKGQVEFIDILSISRESLLQNSDITVGRNLVLLILDKIKSTLDRLSRQYESSFVYVDDISVLLSLGVTLNDVKAFLHYLQIIAINPSKERPVHHCSLVILSHVDNEDEEGSRLGAALTHAAVTHVNVTESRCIVTHL